MGNGMVGFVLPSRHSVIIKTLTMTRSIFLYLHPVLTLIFIMFAAVPAQAGICERYPDQFAENDLFQLRDKVRNILPSRFASTLSRSRLVNADSDDDELLAPEVRIEDSEIVIPIGFQRFQCHSVLLAAQMAALPPSEIERLWSTLSLSLDACTKRNPVKKCLYDIVSKSIELAESRKVGISDSQVQALVLAAEDGLDLIIAHEMAHVIFDHDKGERRHFFSANEELAADNLAQVASLSSGGDPTWSIATLSILALADSLDTPNVNASHPKPGCRADIGRQVAQSLGPKITPVFMWAVLRQKSSAEQNRVAAIPIFGKASSCFKPNFRPTDIMASDFAALLAKLDQIQESELNLSQKERISWLFNLRFRNKESSLLIGNILQNWFTFKPVAPGRTRDLKFRIEERNLLQSVTNRADFDDFSSRARGHLIYYLATIEFDTAPAGSLLSNLIAIQQKQLDEAEFYDPQIGGYFQFSAANLALLKGNCAEWQRRFKLAISYSSNPKDVEKLLPDQVLQPMTSEKCSIASAAFSDQLRKVNGWR
jgi:hypothetical protein